MKGFRRWRSHDLRLDHPSLAEMLEAVQCTNDFLALAGPVSTAQFEVLDAYSKPRIALVIMYENGIRMELEPKTMLP